MHPLPNYARRIEYLESTGRQYIDTGVVADNNTGFSFVLTPFGVDSTRMGAMGGVDEGYARCYLRQYNNTFGVALKNDSGVLTEQHAPGETSPVVVSFDPSSLLVVVGDKTKTLTSAYSESWATGSTFHLFAQKQGKTISFFALTRLYSAKLYRASTLVRDFIPVRVGTVGYLWDEVTGAFFGNFGTGNFNLGTDIAGGASTLPLRGLWPMGRTRQ